MLGLFLTTTDVSAPADMGMAPSVVCECGAEE